MSTSGQSSFRDGILANRNSRRSQESYRRAIFLGVVGLLAIGAAGRLGFEIHRLLFDSVGPIDLLLLRRAIQDWFAHIRVYDGSSGGVHPPASFVLLWPLYGWAPAGVARWLYAGVTALVMLALVALLRREARPAGLPDRILWMLVLVGGYPTAISIGNGQMTPHLLLVAVAGVLIALREPPSRSRDALLAGLFLLALVKPNLTLPFFWVIAFRRGWLRPVALALAAYFTATMVSIALHGTGLDAVRALIAAWYERGERGFVRTGYGNLHQWLGMLGLRDWIFPASGLVFALHGLWAWRHRDADLWVRIGVAAIVARLWAYHRIYDDLLLVFALVALYRVAHGAEDGSAGEGAGGATPAPHARALFLVGSVALLAPITAIVEHASWVMVLLWLAMLVVLIDHARAPASRAG